MELLAPASPHAAGLQFPLLSEEEANTYVDPPCNSIIHSFIQHTVCCGGVGKHIYAFVGLPGKRNRIEMRQ